MKVKTILLIDDNEVDNFITRQMLLKYEVAENIIVQESAMDALRFLDGIRNEPDQFPDYIFLDIRMPEMDGFGFIEEYLLFPDALKDHCIIFMLTSSGDQKDVERAAQYSYVKKFLRKPLDENILKGLNLWSTVKETRLR